MSDKEQRIAAIQRLQAAFGDEYHEDLPDCEASLLACELRTANPSRQYTSLHVHTDVYETEGGTFHVSTELSSGAVIAVSKVKKYSDLLHVITESPT